MSIKIAVNKERPFLAAAAATVTAATATTAPTAAARALLGALLN